LPEGPSSLDRVALLALLATLSAGTGCSTGTPRIEIAGQEASLSPALVGVCSVFMRIANPGNRGDVLLRASVELPGAVAEIHDVLDGKMVKADRMDVPAKGSLELRPGGPHIMVFHLPGEVAPGQELRLRLVFETSGEKRTSVRIR